MCSKYIKSMFSFFVLFAILALNLSTVTSAPNDELPDITASSAILIDSARGQILYGKASSKKIHVSTACKIMTAILSIEKMKLDSKVTVSKDAASEKGSLLSLEAGAKYDAQDLLYAVVLTSANDAAAALAESAGGDVNKFVEMMNAKARELKMVNTVFKNPTGLYDESQYTTAYDLAVLVRYAISNPVFGRFFSTKAIPWSSNTNSKILVNSNQLFWSYEGIDGGKTGFNKENRLSVVTTATKNDMRLIAVVLDSISDKALEDSSKVLDFGFVNYRKSVLVKRDQVLDSISISENKVNLVSNEDIYYIHPTGDNHIRNLTLNVEKNLKLPITKDKILGTADYVLNDNTKIVVNLYSNAEIQPLENFYSTMLKKLKEYKEIYFVVIFLLFLELLLIINAFIRLVRKKMQNKQ